MYRDHVVFTTVGLGTGSGRAQYTQNYLTNLHGNRLSKGNRLVYKEDGKTIDWDETVKNSAWSLEGNPFSKLTRKEAQAKIKAASIKAHLMVAANDYPPDMIGYDSSVESRSEFFKEWSQRSGREQEWQKGERLDNVDALKRAYEAEGRPTLTDESINKQIESSSTPFNKRIGVRVLAPDIVSIHDEPIINQSDAKGLAAFRPRLADYPFEDRIVSGLYNIFQGTKALQTGVGNIRGKLQKIAEEEITPEKALDMGNSRATVYHPDSLGVYFPEMDSTLVQELFGYEPTFNQRRNQLKFLLESFAVKNGLEELVKTKQYARLYQIYKSRQALVKFTAILSQERMSAWDMRFYHRHLVQQVFKITKAQRDATNSTRNILDFSKSIGIDPSLFRYEDGSNMMWLDVLSVLADLGIEELSPLEFGMSPVELLTTETGSVANVLKGDVTSVLPNVVQGSDVAHIIQGIFANVKVKEAARLYVDDMIAKGLITKPVQREENTKHVVLSSLPAEIQKEVLDMVLKDEDLMMGALENLGLHVTFRIVSGKNFIQFQNSKFHAKNGGAYVVPRRGIGTPTVSNVVTGQQDVKFYLTPEAIKKILYGARNAGFFTQLETAVQVNKTLGGSTRVDTLRQQKFGEYLDRHLEQLAEETEILDSLEDGKLARLGTTRLRDELGLELNLYDAEEYFTTADEVTNLTPFQNAMTLDIRVAMERARRYPTLEKEFKSLQRLLTSEENETYRMRIGFLLFVRNNLTRDLTDAETSILMEEHFGTKLDEETLNDLITKTNQVGAMIDRINHSPFKGKNPYLARALKHRQQLLSEPNEFSDFDVKNFMKEFDVPAEDAVIAAQAVKEAYQLSMDSLDLPEAFSTIPDDDLIRIATMPDEFEHAFPEGKHINNQLTNLRLEGAIDDETEIFYRFLISKVLKHNPNLAKYLSIKTENLGTARVAEAVKEGDRFVININTNVMKNMGRMDQVRVFAHEISHIARLAFIRDNGPEWRKLEALFRSKAGRTAIETMLLLMNNNKKYEGFEQDLNYYLSHPEEFIAQWGGWLLVSNTFNNESVLREIQKRSRAVHSLAFAYRDAFDRIKYEVSKISSGLADLDEVVFADIMDLTENLFGFTATKERQIFLENENKSLGLVTDFDTPLNHAEVSRLSALHEKVKATGLGSLTGTEQGEFISLKNKYKIEGMPLLDITQYEVLKKNREAAQGVSLLKPAGRIAPHGHKIRVQDLSVEERMEIAQSTIMSALERGGTVSRSSRTLGGLSRQGFENMFGKKFVNLFGYYRAVGTWNLTQANKTYYSDHPVAAALMHIVGETFSLTTNQFIKETGARSIRENRMYAQQWVERVAFEVGQLQEKATKDEFNSLMEYATMKAANIPVSAPVGIDADKVKQADQLAEAIWNNSQNMLKFIHQNNKDYDTVPLGFRRSLIGSRKTIDDPKRIAEFDSNRQELISAVAEIIKENVLNHDMINGTLFYASGLGPRIKKTVGFNENGMADESFKKEMKRVQNEQPETFAIIEEIMVRQMMQADPSLTETVARLSISVIKTHPDFLDSRGSSRMHMVLHRAALTFYDLVNRSPDIGSLMAEIDKLDLKKTTSAVSSVKEDNFRLAVHRAITSSERITDQLGLFTMDDTLPTGVSNITSKSAILLKAQEQQTLAEIVAGVYLSEYGDYPDFSSSRAIVSSRQLRENPNTAKFVDPRIDNILTDIERSKGFRATSRIAIQDITGITGVDIYGLIEIFRGLAGNMSPVDKKELDEILDVIEQKLQIEQGLNARGLGEEDDLYTNFFLKWGPDITRLAYGPNLNTAAAIMEGGIGSLIVARYGGNPLEFVTDIFMGLFSSVQGVFDVTSGNMDRYTPRGLAINLMRGIEQTTRNGRDIWHHAQDYAVDSPTRWDKYKTIMSRVNNVVFESLAASLTNQAQRIIMTNLNNGNLTKIRAMFATESITNLDGLQTAMNKYGVRGLLPHMVYEMKMAGLFEPGVIEAVTYMASNVTSDFTKSGTLDFVAANKWIESHKFTALFKAKHGFDKATAYRAVAALNNASKSFRNIVLSENNPWDSNTQKGAMRFLNAFYQQFPNLFFAQKILRMSSKMDTGTFATMLIATTVLDLLYNSLLMVALGAIPLVALWPLSDEFIFKKNPMSTIHTILSRNPIFGLGGNLAFGAATQLSNGFSKISERRRSYNEFQEARKVIGRTFDDAATTFIPYQATETLIKDPIAAVYTLLSSGGNLNEQETHDIYNGLLNTFSRLIPVAGELPVRIALNKAVFGDRPSGGLQSSFAVPQKTRTAPVQPMPSSSEIKERVRTLKNPATSPITPPKDLLR
jgi:hypothetical protein